ncbi:MAG: glycosyltransferase family 2 protein [Pseudomonadota bacterium]
MTVFDDNKIAVIIPAFNSESTIERAARSVLSQNLPDALSLELIVVDDGSTDRTVDVVEKLMTKHQGRLRLICQPENAGPSAARNAALHATDAAWFTPLDSDDFMGPDRLSHLIGVARDGLWQIVADNLLISDSQTPDKVIRTLWPEKPAGMIKMTLSFFVRHNLTAVNERSELGFLKPLIDRRQAPHLIGLYREQMRFAEDYDLYTRLLADGARACLIDSAGYYAVQRRGSLSRTPSGIDFERLIAADTDLLQRPTLEPRDRQEIERHRSQVQKLWVWVRAIEAVRNRHVFEFLRCFAVSPSASWALVGKLVQRAIKGGRRKPPQGQVAT